jgi:MoxR-like ATPase
MDRQQLLQLQEAVEKTFLQDSVAHYIVSLMNATRQSPWLLRGASPRATLAVTAMARAVAQLRGRDYVIPGDVKEVFVPTLAHRLILSPRSEAQNRTPESILREVLDTVAPPRLR